MWELWGLIAPMESRDVDVDGIVLMIIELIKYYW